MKKYLRGMGLVLAAMIAGCGGAPTGQITEAPVFNTGGQVLLAVFPIGGDGQGGQVVPGPDQNGRLSLEITVAANREASAVVALRRDATGISAVLTGMAGMAGQTQLPGLQSHVNVAEAVQIDWESTPMNEIVVDQARSKGGGMITLLPNGMDIRFNLDGGRQTRVIIPVPAHIAGGSPSSIVSAVMEGWNDPLNGGWSTTGTFDFYDRARLRLTVDVDREGASGVIVKLLFKESTGVVYGVVTSAGNNNETRSNEVKFGSLGLRPLWGDCPIYIAHSQGRGDYVSEIDGGLELRLGNLAVGRHQISFEPVPAWTPVN